MIGQLYLNLKKQKKERTESKFKMAIKLNSIYFGHLCKALKFLI